MSVILRRQIFEKLGYRHTGTDEKYRISYSFNHASIEIDSRPGIPAFLEIEAESNEKVQEIVQKLGFSMDDTKPWSGKEVFEYYNR